MTTTLRALLILSRRVDAALRRLLTDETGAGRIDCLRARRDLHKMLDRMEVPK